jgi:hypothetical protein
VNPRAEEAVKKWGLYRAPPSQLPWNHRGLTRAKWTVPDFFTAPKGCGVSPESNGLARVGRLPEGPLKGPRL